MTDLGRAVAAVRTSLARGPWRAPTEDALQAAVAAALAGLNAMREWNLGETGRVDVGVPVIDHLEIVEAAAGFAYQSDTFAVSSCTHLIAVEVKLEASTTPVVRQLQRYAADERVLAVVLASTSARLCAAIPRQLAGKPVYAAHLRRF